MKRIIALTLALVLSIGCAAADNKSFNIRFFKDNAANYRLHKLNFKTYKR